MKQVKQTNLDHSYTIPNSPRRPSKHKEKARPGFLIQGGKAEMARHVEKNKKLKQALKNSAPYLQSLQPPASSQGTLKQSTSGLARGLGPTEMLLGSCNIVNNRLLTRQSIFQKRQHARGAKLRSATTSSTRRTI